MTYRNIEIFLAICDNKNNVTRAAEVLFVSQPTVTIAVHEMEKELGVALFDRIGHKLYLTDAGRKFREYAFRIYGIQSDMERTFQNWGKEEILHIGASLTVGSRYLSDYVIRYRKSHPGVQVRIIVAPSSKLELLLLQNQIDFALVEMPMQHSSVLFSPYMEKDMSIIAAPDWLADEMTLEEFCRQPFALRNRGSGTREIFDKVMQKLDAQIEPIMESSVAMALIDAVKHGLGISVLPYGIVEDDLEAGLLKEISVVGLRFPQSFYIAQHRDKILSQNMNNFIEGICSLQKKSYSCDRC